MAYSNLLVLVFLITLNFIYCDNNKDISIDETSGSGDEKVVEKKSFNWNSTGSSRPSVGNRYSVLCDELLKFIPNLCSMESARSKCAKGCNRYHDLDCGIKDPPSATKKMKIKINKKHAIKTNKAKASKRIVGGKESQKGEWPWQAYLISTNPSSMCGGTILGKRFVLTAAHCVREGRDDPRKWKVTVGNYRANRRESFEDELNVVHIMRHKDYKTNHRKHSDIAILQLASDIQLENENKGRICLPDDHLKIPDMNKACYISGWGRTAKNGRNSKKLKHAEVLTVSRATCMLTRHPSDQVDETELCAGQKEAGTDACSGDSGGPMVCQMKKGYGARADERWYAGGVISKGPSCGEEENTYGVYANVTYFKEWIANTLLDQSLQY